MIKLSPAACCMFIAFTVESSYAQAAKERPGSIEAVTVYRGQALVTRLVEIPGPAGLHELVVTDLPEQVVPGSIYAESADGVEVRSVLYRQRPVTHDVREEVRQLDQKIRALQDTCSANAQAVALLAERKSLLDKIEQFTAPTANAELTKGVLDAGTLKDVASYLVEQRTAISQEDFKLKLEKRDLEEQISVLQRERQQLAGGSARTAREALVFVNLLRDGGQLRLRYLVNQASWSPSYSVRAGEDRQNVTVEYLASIQQLSGEDWGNVSMTLSTATPSLVAKAPTLEALRLHLTPAQEQAMAQYGKEEFAKAVSAIAQRRAQLNNDRSNRAGQRPDAAGQPSADLDFDRLLNANGCELQVLEWASSGSLTRGGARSAPEFGDGLSVTYQLSGRTNLPSRSDRQLI